MVSAWLLAALAHRCAWDALSFSQCLCLFECHRDLRGSAWTVAFPCGRGLSPPSVCCRYMAGDDLVLLSGLFEISSNIPFFFLSTSF